MGYEPKINRIKLLCPFKFNLNPCYCETYKCALWLPIQKACSLQIIARGIAFPKEEY